MGAYVIERQVCVCETCLGWGWGRGDWVSAKLLFLSEFFPIFSELDNTSSGTVFARYVCPIFLAHRQCFYNVARVLRSNYTIHFIGVEMKACSSPKLFSIHMPSGLQGAMFPALQNGSVLWVRMFSVFRFGVSKNSHVFTGLAALPGTLRIRLCNDNNALTPFLLR